MSFQEYVLDLGPLFYSPMDNIDFNGEVEEIVNFTTSDATTATTVEASGAVGSDYSIDVDGEGPVNFPLSTAGAVTYMLVVNPYIEGVQDIFTTNEDTISIIGAYEGEILDDSPIGYWRLSEDSGATTASDASGNGNDGTYGGEPVLGIDGALAEDDNTAIEVDGTSHVTVPNISGQMASGFTVEMWIWHEPSSDGETLSSPSGCWNHGQGLGWFIRLANSDQPDPSIMGQVYMEDGTADATANFGIISSEWYHIAFRYRHNDLEIDMFVDGVLVSTSSMSAAFSPLLDSTPIGFGAGNEGFRQMTGKIDEPAIYSRALSDTEIESHYNAGNSRGSYVDINGNESPLISATHWSILLFNNNSWTIEQLNEEEAPGLLVQNVAIFDYSLSAAEEGDLIELAQNGYTIETINEGATLQLTDTGATGLAADWHIISV